MRPRATQWAIVRAFVGRAFGAVAVFEYAFDGSTFDRWLIMSAGLLGGGAVGLHAAGGGARRRSQHFAGRQTVLQTGE
jgi:hypothetical protein